LSIKVILCLQNTQIRRDGQQIEKYINSTNEKVPTPNTNNIIATTIPTVNTTKAGSPEVLTPSSYITFTDMAKRKEHIDADLLCSVVMYLYAMVINFISFYDFSVGFWTFSDRVVFSIFRFIDSFYIIYICITTLQLLPWALCSNKDCQDVHVYLLNKVSLHQYVPSASVNVIYEVGVSTSGEPALVVLTVGIVVAIMLFVFGVGTIVLSVFVLLSIFSIKIQEWL
jgi:predicted neutral ceramidase superfamily lipid hydrolase